ncbi:unnamed protein product [Macrosiphum euphorbiae]|uniref:Secreted protein n=1 Tax=Macrosiphum euphorbiae TaxID=13131 RepID=A0AAV0X717_9HEMI|nr:unnamed protein product [Macrosiphum euphorbiae]
MQQRKTQRASQRTPIRLAWPSYFFFLLSFTHPRRIDKPACGRVHNFPVHAPQTSFGLSGGGVLLSGNLKSPEKTRRFR